MTGRSAHRQTTRDSGIVCCRVGNGQYAFRGADVRHIVRAEWMHGEGAGDGSVGTLDIAGQTVPVFRLTNVLGVTATQARAADRIGQHIAVTGDAGDLVGWLVDRVVRTPLSGTLDVIPLPPVVGVVATTWFEGLLRLGDSSVLVLDPRRLDPRAHRPPRRAAVATVAAPVRNAGSPAAQMVVIFSTPALPRCEAARYAVSGRHVAAIVQPMPPILVPGGARHVAGVAWWRDAVVPLLDRRGRSDRGDAAERRRCLIAWCGARTRESLVAFLVDSEIALHRPAPEDRQVTGVSCPSFASGMFDVGGEMVALLDVDALVASDLSGAGEGQV